MPLPLNYVKEIHSRLAVRYGSAWRGKWSDVPLEALEADWSTQLDGMRPENIRKALESLPHEFPPTAPAFRALGMIREEAAPMAALPAPDPQGLRRIAQSMAPAVNHQETPSEWLARLDRDVKAGTASPARKRHHAIATANGYYGNASGGDVVGHFTPPPADVLPPGMRAEMEASNA